MYSIKHYNKLVVGAMKLETLTLQKGVKSTLVMKLCCGQGTS